MLEDAAEQTAKTAKMQQNKNKRVAGSGIKHGTLTQQLRLPSLFSIFPQHPSSIRCCLSPPLPISHGQARLAKGPSLALRRLREREKKKSAGRWRAEPLGRPLHSPTRPPTDPFWKRSASGGESGPKARQEKKKWKGERDGRERCRCRGSTFEKPLWGCR